jgi:hypothetical protein
MADARRTGGQGRLIATFVAAIMDSADRSARKFRVAGD